MFISTQELEKIYQDDSVLILDARSYKDYSNGHIPGAVNLDLFSFHWVDTSQKGLVSFGEHMRKILSYAGIDENKKIIFYDDVTGMLAARGVWMCLYFSHSDVQMLDGGLSKWTKENLPTETESTIYKPSNLTTPLDPSIIIGFEELNEKIGKVTIIDARSPDEFDGTIPRAARGGHITTAENIDWNNNLDDSGKLKSDSELESLYTMDKESPIVTYCQGAYRAAHSYLSLKKLGFKNVKVYLGSWGEWGNKMELPIEK
ncbi:sulfurtransferase [Candidatus Nitrosopelagicus sp.]|nr:sulfurtransferase [Candidatus Nitrosopelagicus sp.]